MEMPGNVLDVVGLGLRAYRTFSSSSLLTEHLLRTVSFPDALLHDSV